MKKLKIKPKLCENVLIEDAGSEGNSIARVNNLVVFVPFAVPGDVADIRVVRRKRKYLEGTVLKFHKLSKKRTDPVCEHFGICGGCRWQNMDYNHQLFYKEKQVRDNLVRIGKLKIPEFLPILPSPDIFFYRNKLEFTFSSRKWFENKPAEGDIQPDTNALGFHIPGLFDRVIHINRCHLQADPSNDIRHAVFEHAQQYGLSFHDVRTHTGFLRNLTIRTSSAGDIMVILVVQSLEEEIIHGILDILRNRFPGITSLYYVINPKKNDSVSDLEHHLYHGMPVIRETLPSVRQGFKETRFEIGPKSFFQTNPVQARKLYQIVMEFAEIRGHEMVWDLYTGTGTIANYIAPHVKQVTGIESVPEAIEDARKNSALNDLTNTMFLAGEAEALLTPEFIARYGRPDIVITDPPRSGMHEKVIRTILAALPEKVIYVSCNPATQARDAGLLSGSYEPVRSQPVDMFPHTHHVENVLLLRRREDLPSETQDIRDHQ